MRLRCANLATSATDGAKRRDEMSILTAAATKATMTRAVAIATVERELAMAEEAYSASELVEIEREADSLIAAARNPAMRGYGWISFAD